MRRLFARTLAVAALFWLLPGVAAAQTVRGWVLDETDRRPILNTVVSVLHATRDTTLAQQLATDGSFRLVVPDSGTFHLHVAALGYTPVTIEINLAEGAVTTLEVRLRPDAIALDPVRVVAQRREPVFMQDVRRRQLSGFGRYMTREEIDDQGAARLPDVLSTMPGVRVVQYQAGGRTIPLVTTRAASTGGDCFAALYVNGVRHFEMRTDQPGGAVEAGMLERADYLATLSSGEIEAIEVFRGAAEVPAEFGGSTARCGVVAVWLRAGYEPHYADDRRIRAEVDVAGAFRHLTGDDAPDAAFAPEIGFYWKGNPRLSFGMRVQWSRHQLPAATMSQLTGRLPASSYNLPAGSHPMTLIAAGGEARVRLLDRDNIDVLGTARVHRAHRSFSIAHSNEGVSRFSSAGWGAGAGAGVQLRLSPLLALHTALTHEWLALGSIATLDREGYDTTARWRATSLRAGLSYVVVTERR